MIQRVSLIAVVMGTTAYLAFEWMLANGYTLFEARNGVLLLMVLFENVHVFNCRSESRSVFSQNPMRNPLLLFGTITAQLIHIGAMYTPGLNQILDIQPIALSEWFTFLQFALVALFASEVHKLFWKYRNKSNAS